MTETSSGPALGAASAGAPPAKSSNSTPPPPAPPIAIRGISRACEAFATASADTGSKHTARASASSST